MNVTGLTGFIFVLIFLGLMLLFTFFAKQLPRHNLREISAFAKLKRGVGLAVEAGRRLHVSIGYGGVNGIQGGSGLLGLSLIQRIAKSASVSDRPPVTTSGEATLAVLSQDTLKNVYYSIGAATQYDPDSGMLTGLTPFSYAAGAMPVVFDQDITVNVLAGHFGSEVALITDAAERSGGISLAGSDNLSAQAVLYAAADELLIGEELYAAGAYLNAGPSHSASLRTQDIIRWILVGILISGALLKMVGIL